MIKVEIPGWKNLQLAHLVLDLNGTIAFHGKIPHDLIDALNKLSEHLHIHVITADTFGLAEQELAALNGTLKVIGSGDQTAAKRAYVHQLGAESCVAMGNGRNDAQMLALAGVGVAIAGREGGAMESIRAADILCNDIMDALGLLLHPIRLKATLRS